MEQIIIDVREKDEFERVHIEHSINVPLSAFAAVAPGVLNMCKAKKVTFMCFGGARATQAAALAQGLGYNELHDYLVYPGGISQWQKDGRAVKKNVAKSGKTIIQQVQLTVGTMIFSASALAYFVNPAFIALTAMGGMGLLYAGTTGKCGLANLIANAPWNRAPTAKAA